MGVVLITWPTFSFWDPLSVKCKVRDFKFGAQIDHKILKPKSAKVCQRGRGLRRVTYFHNFETPSISMERIKLQTSNLVRGLTARPVTQKNAKLCQKGCGLRHVTYFYNLRTFSTRWTKKIPPYDFCWYYNNAWEFLYEILHDC